MCHDSLYETVDSVKSKYNYHDEPHSFESSMEFLEDFNHFHCEELETTVYCDRQMIRKRVCMCVQPLTNDQY